MKTILVEVCVCTQCVSQGAMHIIESVESLKKFKYQLRHDTRVTVKAKILSDESHRHTHTAPMVMINGIAFQNATNEVVMEHIVNLVRRIPPKA